MEINKKKVFEVKCEGYKTKYFDNEKEANDYLNEKLTEKWIHNYCKTNNGNNINFYVLRDALIRHCNELKLAYII